MKRLFVALWGLAGCASHAAPPTAAAPSASRVLAARRGLWSVVDTLALERAAAIARYGRPTRIRASTFDSQEHPGTIDSVLTLRFPAFESNYAIQADGRTSLQHVTISGPAAGVPPAVTPGAARASLLSYLGEPDGESEEDEGTLLLFKLDPKNDDLGNVLNVLLVDGRVRWISWVFVPDLTWPPPRR